MTIIEEDVHYKRLIPKFCKFCLIIREKYFKNTLRPTAGLPTMACVMWGHISDMYQSKFQPELDGEHGHVITTSVLYMVTTDWGNLRLKLRALRKDDLQRALPNMTLALNPDNEAILWNGSGTVSNYSHFFDRISFLECNFKLHFG